MVTGLPLVSQAVIAATLAALLVATGLPTVAVLFSFTALPMSAWLGCVAAGLLMVLPFELARRWLDPDNSQRAGYGCQREG